MKNSYHQKEADRIQHQLDTLDPQLFAPDGIVRIVLTDRIKSEREYVDNTKHRCFYCTEPYLD